MANNTIYPYGTGGQLPSGIAIVNDLTTGGADKALSAEQGKVINIMINGGSTTIPLSVVTDSCGGRIESNGHWSTTSNQTYYGSIIDISQYRGEKLKIVAGGPTSGGAGGSISFIKTGFQANGAAVDFADGWNGYSSMTAGQEYTFDIPDDAVYVYYYVRSSNTYYTPASITIVIVGASGIIDEIDRLNGRIDDEVYPIVSVDTSTLTSCGGSIGTDGIWRSETNYYGAVVPVTTSRGLKATIVGNNTNGGSYCFLTQGFTAAGNAANFATGYSAPIIYSADATIEAIVPDDAVYLYVYLRSQNTVYTPQSISLHISTIISIEELSSKIDAELGESLQLFSYNIGHFSNGAQKNSTITSSQYVEKVDAFRALLSTQRPDIYGLLEYSAVFGKNASNVDVNTKDELFNFMETEFESSQLNYACYALFGAPRIPLYNVAINDFECLEEETITHTSAVTAQDYRYISADLYALGVSIRLVVTHLAFDTNRPGVLQQAQISELLTKYANDSYVIMMGDWNYDNYSQFTTVGYSLANDGTFITYPGGGTALDNICVKGLSIANVKMPVSNLSDHYPLVCSVYKSS